jgi:hypothetical protein
MENKYLPSSSHNTMYYTWTSSINSYKSLCNSNAVIIDIGEWVYSNGYHCMVKYGYGDPLGSSGISVYYMETYSGAYSIVSWSGQYPFRFYMHSGLNSYLESKEEVISYY